jgi:hypothetical protein
MKQHTATAHLLPVATHEFRTHGSTSGVVAWPRRLRDAAWSVGRFALHFAEMWIAMVAGMMVFGALVNVSGSEAARDTTSAIYQAGMMVSMTVPMVAWMRLRGHGWRHGLEMAAGMLAPVVVIAMLLGLGAGATLPWLQQADGPAMMLGMLGAMLLRREHYTGGHASHAAHSRN